MEDLRCPHCGKQVYSDEEKVMWDLRSGGSHVVSVGGPFLELTIKTTCPHCGMDLTRAPEQHAAPARSVLDLFRPRWRHSDWSVRLAAVERLADQTLLAKIATSDGHERVRQAAVKRLADQAVLAKIAASDEDHNVREVALRMLIDAVERLTDQALLARIATSDGHERVRQAAVERLTDQTLLARIAMSDGDDCIVQAALKRVTGEERLVEIGKSARHETARSSAIDRLMWIAKTDSDRHTRERAFQEAQSLKAGLASSRR